MEDHRADGCVGFLIAGEAGDRAASAIVHGAPPVVTEIGILLLWLSAILTLIRVGTTCAPACGTWLMNECNAALFRLGTRAYRQT